MNPNRLIARGLEVTLGLAPLAIIYQALAANSTFENHDRGIAAVLAVPLSLACLGMAAGIHNHLAHHP